MRKIIIIIFLLFPVMAIAQSKEGYGYSKKNMKVDTVLTDSTAVISFLDLQTFIGLLNKIPHENYIKLTPEAVLNELWNWKIKQKNND